MGERSVIDRLDDVVHVEPHAAIRRQGTTQRVSQINVLCTGSGVLKTYVPEPRGRFLRERQLNEIVDATPRAESAESPACLVQLKPGAAAGPQQRCPRDCLRMTPKIQ